MADWSIEHRAFAVEHFFRHNDSYVSTVRDFRKHFAYYSGKPVFSEKTLRVWVKNFRETGSVCKKKSPGPVRRVRTSPVVARVRKAILKSPTRSARMQARNLNLSEPTVRRILHRDLNFHPYKILCVQQLLPVDYEARMKFSRIMLQKIEAEEIPLNSILITDEAHFYLNGDVNKQNLRYWSSNNPQIISEKPLHSPKVTVWMGVATWGVIGPYFFDGTVNGESYRQLLTEFVRPELTRRRKLSRTWFQQDGATSHTARETMNCLRRMFGSRLISKNAETVWPPRSPDLSTCDYFLWGYLKSRVYKNKPRSLEQLKQAITRQAEAIPKTMLVRVYENFVVRLRNCIKKRGQHLSDVIFKTT